MNKRSGRTNRLSGQKIAQRIVGILLCVATLILMAWMIWKLTFPHP